MVMVMRIEIEMVMVMDVNANAYDSDGIVSGSVRSIMTQCKSKISVVSRVGRSTQSE